MKITKEIAQKYLKTLSIIVGVIGAYLIWLYGEMIIEQIISGDGYLSILGLSLFTLLIPIFGIFCVVTTYRSWKSFSSQSVRRLCGIMIFLLLNALCMVYLLLLGDPSRLPDPTINNLENLTLEAIFGFFIIAGVFLYRKLGKWLTKITFPEENFPPLSKQTIAVIIFPLFGILIMNLNAFSLEKDIEKIIFIGSCLLAVILYNIIIKRLNLNTSKEDNKKP